MSMTKSDASKFNIITSVTDCFGILRAKPVTFIALKETVQQQQLADFYLVGEVYLRPESNSVDGQFLTDKFWPILPERSAQLPKELYRLSQSHRAVEDTGLFGRAYSEISQSLIPDQAFENLLHRLEMRILEITNHEISKSGFAGDYGAGSSLNSGSSSRQTYLGTEVDFDIVIATEMSQRDINHERIFSCSETIANRVSACAEFGEYCTINGINPHPLMLSEIGARGKESFVARYKLQSNSKNSFIFLDLTFGFLPQLVEYTNWINSYFSSLPVEKALRCQAEIRLAKALFRAVPDLCGTAVKGLKPHIIEQLIIQSFDYRSSGEDVGTLDNALQLLFEEAVITVDACKWRIQSFQVFKECFPLWHPGWLAPPERTVAPSFVNLWDLLGSGETEIAAQKWAILMAVSIAYQQLRSHNETFNIPGFVKKVRSFIWKPDADDVSTLLVAQT